MKPVVDEKLIDRICLLSKLELDEAQREEAKRDMEEMLNYLSCLEKVDTSGVAPLYHVLDSGNVFREDVVTNEPGTEEELEKNAPSMQDGFFVVPRTIG